MRKQRGFTLIELLVVIAIIGVLAAILIPNILGAIKDARKTADVANLKELVKQYIAGQAKKYKGPRSTGHRFWVAMICGDGVANGYNVVANQTEVYLSVAEAGLLICPEDDNIQKEDLKAKLQGAIGGGGAAGATIDWCSYAGPLNGYQTFNKNGAIVGCTGSRNNTGYFADGMSVVRQNDEAEFVSWEKAAKPTNQGGYGWTAPLVAPKYQQAPMADVQIYQ